MQTAKTLIRLGGCLDEKQRMKHSAGYLSSRDTAKVAIHFIDQWFQNNFRTQVSETGIWSSGLILSRWSCAWQNQQNDVSAAKTQISLGIRPVWKVCAVRFRPSDSSCGQWRLGGCPCWCESSLCAHILLVLLWTDSVILYVCFFNVPHFLLFWLQFSIMLQVLNCTSISESLCHYCKWGWLLTPTCNLKGSYLVDYSPQLKIALICVKWHHTFAVRHHVSLRHSLLSSLDFRYWFSEKWYILRLISNRSDPIFSFLNRIFQAFSQNLIWATS